MDEVTIRASDDIAVVLNEGGKTARVYVFDAGVRITAPVWNEVQWSRYIERRIAGHCSGPALTEKEKAPPFFSARTDKI